MEVLPRKILFIIPMLYFFSCTKEIEVNIPEQQHKLVVYSTIVPFTLPKPKNLVLKLQSSKYIYDTTQTEITDAQVLYFINGLLKDTLEYVDSSGGYIISNSINDYPVEGNIYSIRISYKGFPSVEASTIIPSKVKIINAKVTPVAFFDETGNVFSEIVITFTDPQVENNYYEVAISDIAFSYDNFIDYYELSTNDEIITGESYYPSLIQLEVRKPKSLLFSDKKINGKTCTLHIYYSPPQYETDKRYIKDHFINIHLRNVTKEYYKFMTSMILQQYHRQEDILYGTGEPVNVESNINNGYGLFAGFNNDIVSLHICEQVINE